MTTRNLKSRVILRASNEVKPIAGVEVTIAVPDNQEETEERLPCGGVHQAGGEQVSAGALSDPAQDSLCLPSCTPISMDSLLSNPLLTAMSLSLLPLAYGSTPATKLTLIGLCALVSWLRGSVPVNKHLESSPPPKISSGALMRAMQTLLAMDNTELVFVFILMCRSLGLGHKTCS